MGLAGSLKRALRWPAFLLSLVLLYWSVPLASMGYFIHFLDFRTQKRGDVFGWAIGMKTMFGIRTLKVGTQDVYRGKCMYLINHRSWGDFVVDQYLTEGRSTFLSRAMVAVVFPFFMAVLVVMKAVMVFKRGKIPDKEKFNRWIDQEFEATPQTAIAVYPEGHRSTMTESLPLKRGMLHYAFTRKMVVQIVICANKESILSEKHQVARWGQTVWAGYSEPIYADKYSDFEEFMTKIQSEWDELWKKVFSANPKELPELINKDPQLDTPAKIRYGTSLMICLVNILFLVIIYALLRTTAWVLSWFGPLQGYIIFAFVFTIAASLLMYSRPYNSVKHHARKLKKKLSRASTGEAIAPPTDLAAHTAADLTPEALSEETPNGTVDKKDE